jgi:hypothetical protein
MPLDYIAASLLYLLWRRRRAGDGSLVTVKALWKELLSGASGIAIRRDVTFSAVKKALHRLRAEELVEFGAVPKDTAEPGPTPTGFRLSRDPGIVQSPATATMIMTLHNHPAGRLTQRDLVDEVFQASLQNDRNEHLTKEEISELITWCIRRGYFQEIEERASASRSEMQLRTTSKVDMQGPFLARMTAEFRPRAALEPETSSSVEEPKGNG